MTKEHNPKQPLNPAIYRGSRDIVERAAIDQVRKGDPCGDPRSVFAAGLMACALGARDAEESATFIERLSKESQEPGWMLAAAGIAADSAPFMRALLDTGRLSHQELVWNGFNTTEGEPCRDFPWAAQAVRNGAHRCLGLLDDQAPSEGLLAAAAVEGRPVTFRKLLARARRLGLDGEIDQALASVCSESRDAGAESEPRRLIAQELLDAGARWEANCMPPRSWDSWNGSTVKDLKSVWVPSLLLAEPGDALPAGASAEGSMDATTFFGNWSSACLLVRSALAEGSRGKAEQILSSTSGWEMARASTAGLDAIAPIALLAMGSPEKTSSGLRRDPMEPARIVEKSPALEEALRDGSPMSLAKCAIGAWLWRPLASPMAKGADAHFPSIGIRGNPMVEAIAAACGRFGIRPLGPRGSQAAAQRFAESMRHFGEAPSLKRYSYESDVQHANRLEHTKETAAKNLLDEKKAARTLALFMDETSAENFLRVVEEVHANEHAQDPGQRLAAKEKALLGMLGASPSRGRGPSL